MVMALTIVIIELMKAVVVVLGMAAMTYLSIYIYLFLSVCRSFYDNISLITG